MDGPQRRYRTGKSDGKPDDVHPAGGGGNIEIRAEFTDLLSLAASEIIAYDAEKAATVTRLSVSGDLTDEVTAAIFDKFQNLLFLELTDAKAIPDNFMYDAGSRAPKQTKLEELNAPEVTSVGVNAFRNSVLTAVNNSSLRTVHLPKVQTMGERAFSDLWTLEEAGSAFFYCGGPTSISLPKLKTAGESCFAYSTKLTQIDIPNVEKLEKMAMYACNGLLSFSGEKVESVGAQCFERCYALKEVSFPAATAFGSGCFIDCESLTKVNFPLCTAISDKMFFIAQASVCTSTLKTIDLSNITTIGTSAFEGCKALEDVVDFSKVTTVGERAFRECITLKNVDLSNVTTTGDYAFFRCWGFTGELNMPKLTAPGKYLFRECKNITKVSAPVLENMSLIYVRRMYRSCGHRYARTQEGGKLLFQQMRRFDESGYAHGRDHNCRRIQRLCKYRDGQSPQREKHRWNRLQQLLAHHLHFPSGASDLHRRGVQRNDRPDEL